MLWRHGVSHGPLHGLLHPAHFTFLLSAPKQEQRDVVSAELTRSLYFSLAKVTEKTAVLNRASEQGLVVDSSKEKVESFAPMPSIHDLLVVITEVHRYTDDHECVVECRPLSIVWLMIS